MTYSEEKEFTLRLVLRCDFPDGYDGELDGYEWTGDAAQIAGELVRAAVGVLAGRKGWKLHGGNRGRSSDDEVTLVLERVLPVSPTAPTDGEVDRHRSSG